VYYMALCGICQAQIISVFDAEIHLFVIYYRHISHVCIGFRSTVLNFDMFDFSLGLDWQIRA
jgi:hypothetical protein